MKKIMDRTIVSREFEYKSNVSRCITNFIENGWNINNAFIQIVYDSDDRCYIVFYEKYLDEPIKLGKNL